MSEIVIGKAGHENVAIDRKVLMTTRLLITSDSGGGKTWLLKRLIEQAFGQVGIIVIDPEGEFAPLRTKFDFFLVGKGGDTPADIRTAEKVARTLLTGRASAICDIYEMAASERHVWVQRFLDALLDAPKELRHPYFVIVDESHMFCPEHGKGESESADAMRGLATRGRKRMLCGIYATQRLATLSKDLTGMCLNRLVGPTFESVNQQRGALELGIPKGDQEEFFANVKMLEPGYFYAIGRAITKDLKLVHIGPIETPHGQEALKYELRPPPPTEKVRGWLAKLGDLPKQAEEEARTVAEFKKQIRDLKAQLRTGPAKTQGVRVADPRAIERAVQQAKTQFEAGISERDRAIKDLSVCLGKIGTAAGRAVNRLPQLKSVQITLPKVSGAEIQTKGAVLSKRAADHESQAKAETSHPLPENDREARQLKSGARKMLQILAQWHPETRTRDQLGALAGFAPTGGTFAEYLSALRKSGFISENGHGVSITEQGLDAAGAVDSAPSSTNELVSMWKGKFKAGVGKMLDVLVEVHPDYISREDLGEATDFASSGGTFAEYLSCLRRARLIEESGNQVKAAESLFP